MISDQARRMWPSGAVSATLTVYFRVRANTGVGTYTAVGDIPALVLVYPNGRVDGKTHESIRESIISYLLNEGIDQHWSPITGTHESELRATLSNAILRPGDSSAQWTLVFDGQFGPVLIG